jgi:hypothetical protein
MTMDAETGLVSWTPVQERIGSRRQPGNLSAHQSRHIEIENDLGSKRLQASGFRESRGDE